MNKQIVRLTYVSLILVGALLYTAIGERTGYAYVAGGLCSIFAGLAGMKAATRANVRTSEAARASGQTRALRIAFHGGAVMGLSVASLGLLGIGRDDSEWERASPNGFGLGTECLTDQHRMHASRQADSAIGAPRGVGGPSSTQAMPARPARGSGRPCGSEEAGRGKSIIRLAGFNPRCFVDGSLGQSHHALRATGASRPDPPGALDGPIRRAHPHDIGAARRTCLP